MAEGSDAMRKIRIAKVTLNVGAGESGDKLEKAQKLLAKLTSRTPVQTLSHERNPTFKITKGKPIGTKVTLRGKPAEEMLRKALEVRDNKLSAKGFDRTGSFSFGIGEYIDLPGVRYDPAIGMYGFDVAVTLERPGRRVARRRRAVAKVGRRQRITTQEAIEWARAFGIEVEE